MANQETIVFAQFLILLQQVMACTVVLDAKGNSNIGVVLHQKNIWIFWFCDV